MNERELRQVVFLDTNVLHYINLYLTLAKEKRLYPFCPDGGSAADARGHLRNQTSKSLRNSLRKGLNAVAALSTRDFQVEYSPVSELELIAGRTRGRAIEKAAKEGIPDRMWTRFHDEEIDSRLSMKDLADIGTGIGALRTSLEAAGIQVIVSSRDRAGEAFDLAREIGQLIYLGFADSVIYASALVAEADYLITFDNYLEKTVNCIRTGSSPYDEIRNRLRSAAGRILLLDARHVTLPEARQQLEKTVNRIEMESSPHDEIRSRLRAKMGRNLAS